MADDNSLMEGSTALAASGDVVDEEEEAIARSLTGPQKALLFMVSLDESVATGILSHLNGDELRRLKESADLVTEVTPAQLLHVHREFAYLAERGVPTSLKGSGAYLRRLAGRAHGEGYVADLWTERKKPEGALGTLQDLDAAAALGMLENEHPQTVAVVLSLFDPSKAGEILSKMPGDRQADILLRLAKLESVAEDVISDIEQVFAGELAGVDADGGRRIISGLEAAADVVKRLDGEISEQLIDQISITDPEAADKLRKSLFTFEDLLRIDGRGMQTLLKDVATDQLVVALKSASAELREKVFGNISSRAANMLREELELLGPVRVSDVETAQQAIVDVALNLEKEKRIQIARDGGDDYV